MLPLDSDSLGQVEEEIRDFRSLLSRTPVKVCCCDCRVVSNLG
jgi:hypothetical protein